jgi:hypothetical protein
LAHLLCRSNKILAILGSKREFIAITITCEILRRSGFKANLDALPEREHRDVQSFSERLHVPDPSPYILLNLSLSMLAAVQTPVILMSQNRQSVKDRLDAGHH